MDNHLSLLGLFHPDGNVGTYLIIGRNCPPRLRPSLPVNSSEKVDLVILAPSQEEFQKEGWLREAAGLFASSLTPDGVGILLAAPRWRYRTSQRLKKFGFQMELAVGLLPNWATSQYLVPFSSNIARYAFSVRITKPAWKSYLARAWFHSTLSDQLLGYLWPSAAFVFRRPGARPLFEWLFHWDHQDLHTGIPLIHTSWRGKDAVSLLYLFPKGENRPAAVAKVILGDPAILDISREENVLASLGPSAQEAGARVPHLIPFHHPWNQPSMLQTLVDGQPVDDLLRSHPGQLDSMMRQIACWLDRWHHRTVYSRPVGQADLDHMILQPANLLAPLMERGEEYRDWLAALCQAVAGLPGSFVATHNDLTMANLLIDPQGHLGVIDWESGQVEGWPLVDFFYAMTDAVMTSKNSFDRLAAFKACFAYGGRHRSSLAQYQAHLESTAMLNKDLAELCFHACWLHHARNEYAKNRPADNLPFLGILRWLALNSVNNRGSIEKA